MTEADILGLEGKGALVVGGGRGIGRETALLLARAGAHVAVGDVDHGRGEAVAAEVAALGVKSQAVYGDVTVPQEAEAMVQAAADFVEGRLEVVINIVGLASWVTVLDMGDQWERDLAMNLHHHLYVSRAAARIMIAGGIAGRMAMVASVDGFYGSPNHPAYGVAKAGVMSLARTMAQEWGVHGIRVNVVAPDAILTPRVRAMLEARGFDVAEGGIPQGDRPLQRMGQPTEIAGPLVFLVSDLSSYVSGQTVIVDGGMFGVPGGSRGGTDTP